MEIAAILARDGPVEGRVGDLPLPTSLRALRRKLFDYATKVCKIPVTTSGG